jgi:biopolymer transport protein TolR
MAMKVGSSGDDLNSEINVTPFVDVMLVLLIIFMITAPLINQTGVELDLPQVVAQNIDDPNQPLKMSIKAGNQLFLGGTQIKWAELAAKVKANPKVQHDNALYIEADTHLQYGSVITAMAIVKNAGVQKVMFLTDPSATLKVEDLDSAAAK